LTRARAPARLCPVADFHQTGAITTLHRLGRPDWRRSRRTCCATAARARSRSVCRACTRSCTARAQGHRRHAARRLLPAPDRRLVSGTDEERTEYEDMRALFDGVRTVDGAPPILLWNSGRA
jgi:hypothetical protein